MSETKEKILNEVDPLFLDSKKLKTKKGNDLRKLLKSNVVELIFKRRNWPIKHPGAGQDSEYRRMMATSDWKFLQNHKSLFKFVPPKGAPRSKSWYKDKKLAIVHDLIRQTWRMISLDDYEIVKVVPLSNKKYREEYKTYYKNLLKKYGRKKLMKRFND